MPTSLHILDKPSQSIGRVPLDLSVDAVKRHWRRNGVGDAVGAMEATETWTLDGADEVESAVANVSRLMSVTPSEALMVSVSASSADVVDFMGYLKSGRALLFFKWITDTKPELAAVLIAEARSSGEDFGVILIERLRVLERQHLLSRVFSPERIALVLEILSEAGLSSAEE